MKVVPALPPFPARLTRSLRAAFLATLLAAPASGDAASSNIVGFYQVQIPAGNSAWVCGLVGTVNYEGAAVTVTADVDGKALVTFDAPGWNAGQFNLHYAEPLTGSASGLAIDILSNTTDTLKLDTTPAAAGLTSGMTFTVRKHATLAGLLPDGGGFLPFNDTISLITSTGTQRNYFFNNGTQKWINVLNVDSSNVVIRPGQGFVIQLASPRTVVLGKGEICHVKTTPTRVTANANVPNLVGALNPVAGNTTLAGLGILSSLQPFNDSVVTLNAGSLLQTGTYLSNGSNFINGLGQNSNATTLPAGASVVVNVNAVKNVNLTPVPVSP